MDRGWNRSRLVNQWFSRNPGIRLAVCNILWHISVDCANYAPRASTHTSDNMRLDWIGILFISIWLRCCNYACISNGIICVHCNHNRTRRNFIAQCVRGNVGHILYQSALRNASRFPIIVCRDFWSGMVLGRGATTHPRKQDSKIPVYRNNDINRCDNIYSTVCCCTLLFIPIVWINWKPGVAADIFGCDYATGNSGNNYCHIWIDIPITLG